MSVAAQRDGLPPDRGLSDLVAWARVRPPDYGLGGRRHAALDPRHSAGRAHGAHRHGGDHAEGRVQFTALVRSGGGRGQLIEVDAPQLDVETIVAWPDHGHFVPDIGRCHCYAWNRHHLVGDRLSGAVYEMSHAFLDDVIVGP